MGWPLYHSSRAFAKVNVETEQWIPVDDGSNEDERSAKSALDTYP